MQLQPTNVELPRQIAGRFLAESPSAIQEQTGGLSGARVWRVESSRGTFALRQYPTEFPTVERLRWLHRFLKEVRDHGCRLLPCPVAAHDGATWIKHESQFWELLTWIHGDPLLETNPSRELLIAAATALAELHRQLDHAHHHALPHLQWKEMHADGIRERRQLLQDWITTDEALLAFHFASGSYPQVLSDLFVIQRNALRKHRVELLTRLDASATTFVKIFPVLRDVQPGHVLFQDSQVAGFIDLGAMRLDSAAADLARLLQRWSDSEPAWDVAALEAYHKLRPITENELRVLDAYDYSARLLTGVQWLRWIVLEQREFSPAQLEARLPPIIQRLQKFLDASKDAIVH